VSADEIVGREGTVVQLGGGRVGVGNIWERPYVLPGGTEQRGLTAMLSFPDDSTLVAGRGSELDLAGQLWQVVDVSDEREGSRGSITFARQQR
jgi:hypothetical protein